MAKEQKGQGRIPQPELDQRVMGMETVSQMANIVELWDAVQQRKFNDEQDTIKWRWTADGS